MAIFVIANQITVAIRPEEDRTWKYGEFRFWPPNSRLIIIENENWCHPCAIQCKWRKSWQFLENDAKNTISWILVLAALLLLHLIIASSAGQLSQVCVKTFYFWPATWTQQAITMDVWPRRWGAHHWMHTPNGLQLQNKRYIQYEKFAARMCMHEYVSAVFQVNHFVLQSLEFWFLWSFETTQHNTTQDKFSFNCTNACFSYANVIFLII